VIRLVVILAALLRFAGVNYELPSPQGVDHVVVYADLSAADAYMEYTGGRSDFQWRDFSGTTVQSGMGAETLYPQADHGYILYTPDTTISIFVKDYQTMQPDYSACSLTADLQCDKTVLTLTGSVPEATYTTPNGGVRTLPRGSTVSFTTLAWGGDDWQDSLAVDQVTVVPNVATQTLTVGPTYRETAFVLDLDPWAAAFQTEHDTLVSEQYQAIAVCSHPQAVVVSRDYNGKGEENEPKRPIDEEEISGRSAPLEINFLSNGNKPTAMYYRWQISKGSQLIVERFDETQRYTFMDEGAYTVKVWVYNDYCTTDSTVFNVSIATSLLKVPNVFSPNGDGVNDEFRVLYRSLAEFHCWVYNRWGKLVYKWDDPAKGWDGTINGHPAAEGAYYYIIRARGTDADPSEKYHKNTVKHPAATGVYQLSGHINLIR